MRSDVSLNAEFVRGESSVEMVMFKRDWYSEEGGAVGAYANVVLACKGSNRERTLCGRSVKMQSDDSQSIGDERARKRLKG